MSELDELTRRLARLEDILAIQRVIASYGPLVDLAADDAHAEEVAELWAPDGVYDIGPDELRFEGREAIARLYRRRHMAMVRTGVAHVMGMPLIRLDGDRATALNYTCVFRPDGEDRFAPWRVSANSWLLERVDDDWVVVERRNRMMLGDEGEGLGVVTDVLPGLLDREP